MRRLALPLLGLVLVGVIATPALAKSYWIDSADTDIVVNDDGSLLVTERITYAFSGSFSGAYRDILLRPGESISDVTVADAGGLYKAGGCVDLGCNSPPGTFGVTSIPGYVRIVWHYDATDANREFAIEYTMIGVVTAYEDVVDVNLQVWGDQWPVGVDHVTARIHIPGDPLQGDVRVWGHPYEIDGSTSLGDDGTSPSLVAFNVPSETWVELRGVFPTSLLATTSGARIVAGDGLQTILDEETLFAQQSEAANQAARTGFIIGVLAALGLALGLGITTYLRYGKEPRVVYDQEYEHAPPTDLPPAEVGALLSQGHVAEQEFTATLFDLIRKGAISAKPIQTVRSTWGGLRQEDISDLELGLTDNTTGFRDYEQSVLTIVRRVLDDGPLPLSQFRTEIREDASANAKTYQIFRTRVLDAIKRSDLLDTSGNVASALTVALAIVLVLGSFFVLPGLLGGRPGGVAMAILIAVGMLVGAVILIVIVSFRRVRVKRTRAGALEAARWDAFKRYLTDFSNLEEAPAISLELWDRYLVYAIAFGVAEEVLEQARLHAPPELETRSSIYWFGNYGYTGGHTENAFAGIESALTGAFTAPSSSGGGGASPGVAEEAAGAEAEVPGRTPLVLWHIIIFWGLTNVTRDPKT
jgi:uncharacterized membrane protein